MLWFLTKPIQGKDSFQIVQMLILPSTTRCAFYPASLNSAGLMENYHETPPSSGKMQLEFHCAPTAAAASNFIPSLPFANFPRCCPAP